MLVSISGQNALFPSVPPVSTGVDVSLFTFRSQYRWAVDGRQGLSVQATHADRAARCVGHVRYADALASAFFSFPGGLWRLSLFWLQGTVWLRRLLRLCLADGATEGINFLFDARAVMELHGADQIVQRLLL